MLQYNSKPLSIYGVFVRKLICLTLLLAIVFGVAVLAYHNVTTVVAADIEPREIVISSVVVADKIYDSTNYAEVERVYFEYADNRVANGSVVLFMQDNYIWDDYTQDYILVERDFDIEAHFEHSDIGNGISVTVLVTLRDTPLTRNRYLTQDTVVTIGNILHIPTARHADFVELQQNIIHIREGTVLSSAVLPDGWQWQQPDLVISQDMDRVVAMWIPDSDLYAIAYRSLELRVESDELPILFIVSILFLGIVIVVLILVVFWTRKKPQDKKSLAVIGEQNLVSSENGGSKDNKDKDIAEETYVIYMD